MCTNFKVPTAKDGTVVVGRSLEFPVDLPTALSVLPSDYEGRFAGPDGNPGERGWSATFGIVGMCVFDRATVLFDGLNTAGLSMHVLYMPGYCDFQPYKGDGSDVAETELGAWLLGTCASTEEVKAALEGKNVWGLDPGMGFVPPVTSCSTTTSPRSRWSSTPTAGSSRTTRRRWRPMRRTSTGT